MNRHPPPQGDRLDAEERMLAALLPRPHGRSEPGADLDARILAAAQAAVAPNPAPASKHRPLRQPRWILPASVAATVALAAGLSWQLRPPAMRTSPTSATASAPVAKADDGTMSVRMIERQVVAPPPPPPPLVVAPPARGVARPAPPPAVVAAPTEPARDALDHFDDEATGALAAEPASPQPAAAPPIHPQPAPALAKSARTDDAAREQRAAAAGNSTAQAQETAAKAAADATTLDAITVAGSEEPDEEVPPATADAPEVREAWLRRIGELLKQGKAEDAKASLAELRRRYPDAVLPPELRKLEH